MRCVHHSFVHLSLLTPSSLGTRARSYCPPARPVDRNPVIDIGMVSIPDGDPRWPAIHHPIQVRPGVHTVWPYVRGLYEPASYVHNNCRLLKCAYIAEQKGAHIVLYTSEVEGKGKGRVRGASFAKLPSKFPIARSCRTVIYIIQRNVFLSLYISLYLTGNLSAGNSIMITSARLWSKPHHRRSL